MTDPTLCTLPLTDLQPSRFNARRQRSEAQVTRLAERMQRNGFETSRALWVYPENGHYEVFAGGTRLAAAQQAGLTDVPALVYPADDPERISRLADEDNENDEYHVPVPLPDIWAEYQRLNDEEGWTQEQIGKAKGVGQASVSRRLKYAAFPQPLQDAFIQHGFLTELHAEELTKLSKLDMPPWLTRNQALTEIVATVLDKHRGSSAGKAPTATVFRTHVEDYNAMITLVTEARAQMPAPFSRPPKATAMTRSRGCWAPPGGAACAHGERCPRGLHRPARILRGSARTGTATLRGAGTSYCRRPRPQPG
jgi:ParB/RepB/Spo0J family partition protein